MSAASRLAILSLAVMLTACGGRLTPPDVPPLRAELDRLQRAYVDGDLEDPARRSRLALLIDRYENATDRADVVDGPTAAAAWRAWGRMAPDWPSRALEAAMAEPQAPSALALAALVDRFAAPGSVPAERLMAARTALRPAARCMVDAFRVRGTRLPAPRCPPDDVAAAYTALEPAADSPRGPEADRWLATIALWGPTPDRARAEAAIDRWLTAWPDHAAGWLMAGYAAADDTPASPAERLAWSGAAWSRAAEADTKAVRARALLAELERDHGLPARAEEHIRLGGVPDGARPHGRPLAPRFDAATMVALRPVGAFLRTVPEWKTRPGRLLDRTHVTLAPDGRVRAVRQIVDHAPVELPGCIRRSRIVRKATLNETVCAGYLHGADGVWHVFPSTPAAVVELVVRSDGRARFESHDGAPGAQATGDQKQHTFTLPADLAPGRQPAVRIVPPVPVSGVAPPPRVGWVDRLEARQVGSDIAALAATLDPERADATERLAARARAAGLAVEAVWLADGRAARAAVRLPDGRVVAFGGGSDPARVVAASGGIEVGVEVPVIDLARDNLEQEETQKASPETK